MLCTSIGSDQNKINSLYASTLGYSEITCCFVESSPLTPQRVSNVTNPEFQTSRFWGFAIIAVLDEIKTSSPASPASNNASDSICHHNHNQRLNRRVPRLHGKTQDCKTQFTRLHCSSPMFHTYLLSFEQARTLLSFEQARKMRDSLMKLRNVSQPIGIPRVRARAFSSIASDGSQPVLYGLTGLHIRFWPLCFYACRTIAKFARCCQNFVTFLANFR